MTLLLLLPETGEQTVAPPPAAVKLRALTGVGLSLACLILFGLLGV